MKRLILHAVALVLMVLFSIGRSGSPSLRAAELPTLEVIENTWKAREQATQSARFAWQSKQTYAKGAFLNPKMGEKMNPKGELLPSTDQTMDEAYKLCFAIDKMAFRYSGHIWMDDQGAFSPQEYASSYDGKDSKMFWAQGKPSYPKGVLTNENKNTEVNNYHCKPILLTYRALHKTMGSIQLGGFEILPTPGLIDDKECIILRDAPSRFGGPYQRTLWLDPKRGFVVLRYATTNSAGVQTIKVDIDYAQDRIHGAVPSSWRIVCRDDNGWLRESSFSTVTEFAINPAIDDNEFRLEFPVNTLVTDRKSRARQQFYVVRENGAKRPVTGEEVAKASYDQILKSETGRALDRQNSIVRYIVFGSAIVGAALLIVLIVRKVWKRRPKPNA